MRLCVLQGRVGTVSMHGADNYPHPKAPLQELLHATCHVSPIMLPSMFHLSCYLPCFTYPNRPTSCSICRITHGAAQAVSWMDVGLRSGTGDEAYLAALHRVLHEVCRVPMLSLRCRLGAWLGLG